MRVAVLGGGAGARPHFKALQRIEDVEFIAVAEINPERRAEIEATFGVRTFADYRELLETCKPEAVLVALPHALHVEATLACIEAGAHVLVEKPLAITVEGCDAIIRAAAAAGKTLAVGHTHHFIPGVMEARDRVREGEVGDVLFATDCIHAPYYTATRPRWFFDRAMAGGGSWVANGVHLVDRICWILDELPRQVYARMTYHPEYPELENSVTATFAFASGRSATITMAMMENGRMEGGEIHGTKGSLRFSMSGKVSLGRGGEYTPLPVRYSHDARELQMREFVAAVRGERPPAVTGEWGREVVRAVLAAYASHERGEAVALDSAASGGRSA